MKLSRTVTYALHATLQLARAETSRPVPCSRLATEGRMPERFLLQILRSLVTHGILRSTRGVDGGYSLRRNPGDISLLEVIEAVDGPMNSAAAGSRGASRRVPNEARMHLAGSHRPCPATICGRSSWPTCCRTATDNRRSRTRVPCPRLPWACDVASDGTDRHMPTASVGMATRTVFNLSCLHLPADLQPRLDLAVEAVREAGRITLEYFRRDDLDVELKCDDTPVTVADRRAEEHLRQRIAAAFPARRHSRRRTRRAAGRQRLPLDPRPHRRHQIVHPRRAAVLDAGGRGVRRPKHLGRDPCSRLGRDASMPRAGSGPGTAMADGPPRRRMFRDGSRSARPCSSPAR